jgi:hypothetical protein
MIFLPAFHYSADSLAESFGAYLYCMKRKYERGEALGVEKGQGIDLLFTPPRSLSFPFFSIARALA